MAKVTTIAEGRELRKKRNSYERVRVVEPHGKTLVRVRLDLDGAYELKWQLTKQQALELATALRKAALLRESSEILQKYPKRRA